MRIVPNTQFPTQKKSTSTKGNKWGKDCIQAAEMMTMYGDSSVRQSLHNKQVNYNLYADILDPGEIEKVVNPAKLSTNTFPATMRNYPLSNPKIDLLVGEESKRKFDWKIRVVNDDAVSEIEQNKKDLIYQSIMQSIESEEEENIIRKRMEKLNSFLNFEYQDLRERRATHILKYLYKSLHLGRMFNDGFKDALISSEEIYCVDIIANEPIVRRVNPLNLFTVRSGDSSYIEDADIIIEATYQPIGKIIDNYYEELKPGDIDQLEGKNKKHSGNKGEVNYQGAFPLITTDLFGNADVEDGMIEVTSGGSKGFEGTYDTEGNVRVIRVVWKSFRKLGKLTYYDEEGNRLERIVDENYISDESRGEEIEWLWVNEWWEGTKIADDIFVKIQPRPIQFRRMDNLSASGSGYVGTIYNTNNSRAMSLMDRMKPYQYLYNIFMYRTDLAFAKNKGIIGELDISKMPDGWKFEDWLHYAESLNWIIVDSFKESDDGRLAGQFNAQGGRVMNMEMGSYIQQHVEMLRFLEDQMGQIAGVTKQREGQISNRETVGGIERSVTQSSHITEPLFAIHDNTKLRVLEVLLETAKYVYKNESKKMQYVLDDMSTAMFDLDGEQFNESEYGLTISNSGEDQILFQKMEQLAQAAIQNGNLTFGQLLTIYHSDSISSVRRKIEASEREMREQQAQQQQQQLEAAQALKEAELQDKEADREVDVYKVDKDNQTKLLIAGINAESKKDEGFQGEDNSLDKEKLELQKQKIMKDFDMNFKKLDELRRSNKVAEKQKDEEIKIKRKIANKPKLINK